LNETNIYNYLCTIVSLKFLFPCKNQGVTLTLLTACSSQDVPHTGVAYLPIVAITVVGHSPGPLKALLAPLFASLDTFPATVGGDIGRRSLTTSQARLPASLGWMRHDRLIASGVLGGDAAWHLECVPKEVAMLASVWWHTRVYDKKPDAHRMYA
jgi:hypothetical protein